MELFGQTERRLLDMYQVYLGMAERMKKYAAWTIYVDLYTMSLESILVF